MSNWAKIDRELHGDADRIDDLEDDLERARSLLADIRREAMTATEEAPFDALREIIRMTEALATPTETKPTEER